MGEERKIYKKRMWNRKVTVGIQVVQYDKMNTMPDFALYAGLGTFELELKKANAYLRELEKAREEIVMIALRPHCTSPPTTSSSPPTNPGYSHQRRITARNRSRSQIIRNVISCSVG